VLLLVDSVRLPLINLQNLLGLLVLSSFNILEI
jgi:hypothetical protein